MTDKNIKYLKKDYFESNYFQSNFNSNSKLVEIKQVYDLTNIFLKQLESLLNISCSVDEISNLHNKLDENLKVYDQKFRINQISNRFYDMPDAFKNKYIELLKLQLRELIGQDFYFQDNPTLRVQVPHISAKSVLPFYHSDIQQGHPPYEINFWLPLNLPSNLEGYGFSISSLKDSVKIYKKYDFDISEISKNSQSITNYLNPISTLQNFDYGKGILFDSRRLHSGQPLENHTRVSIDIRVMPVEVFHKFNHDYQGTGRNRVTFKPGEAYNSKSIDNL